MDATHPTVTIAGNIATGKTRLARVLGEALSAPVFEERWQDNPWFGTGRRFQAQLWFLVSAASDNSRMTTGGIQERSVHEHALVFARAQLHGRERGLLEEVYGELASDLVEPRLMIHLYAPPVELLQRILARGRPGERTIGLDYLEMLDELYESFVAGWAKSPVIRIDTGELDVRRVEHRESVVRTVKERLGTR